MPESETIKRVLIVTDAWHPQVNGVVRTMMNTIRGLEGLGYQIALVTPQDFRTFPCPSYPEIRLSLVTPHRIEKIIEELAPDALHIATEGPLGWAARRAAIRRQWAFTTAYHTRFPEYVHARTGLPLKWLYSAIRRFHAPATAVLAPTHSIIKTLQERQFKNVAYWSRGVDHEIFYPRIHQGRINREHPVFLYAGRLAVEKNIRAFLDLDLPGEKWVAGEGPLEKSLKKTYQNIRWIGVVSQHELADIYSRADVFVFPSRTDTFGLVLVEAMACGLPVAAFPVEGPMDVVASSGAGVLSDDLRDACLRALEIPRSTAIARARVFTWETATAQFEKALVSMRHLPIYPSPSSHLKEAL